MLRPANHYVLALCISAVTSAALADVISPSQNLPPLNKVYVGQFDTLYSVGVILRNPILYQFLQSQPPPPLGGTQIHTTSATVDGEISLNGGATYSPVSGPADVVFRVTSTTNVGVTRNFDTEMLQLNLSGGTLPAGALLRESPTLASTGQTTITDIGGGNFQIHSFFDVFTELSLNNGQTWSPAINGSGRIEANPIPSPHWNLPGGGNWNTPGNWSGESPNGVDASANFGSAITASSTVFSDIPVTVGAIKFDNTHSYVLAGASALTIDVSTGSGSIAVMQGNHKINLPLVIADNTLIDVAAGATLTIADPATIQASKTVTKSGNLVISAPLTLEPGAKLVMASGPLALFGAPSLGSGAAVDVKTNSLTVDYRGQSDPANAIKAQLASAFAGGNWSGSGITSSATIAGKTGVGWKDDPELQSILIKETLYGDVNLDGFVTSGDFGVMATHFNQTGVWSTGDFNYDGLINGLDFGALVTNFGGTLSAPALAALVPEPVALGMIILAATSLAPRRAAIGESARRRSR